MPGSFRRANLRGSDELFRPTRPDDQPSPQGAVASRLEAMGAGLPTAEEAAARTEGRLIRLTEEEVDILVDAIQRQKYPTATRVPTKPPMDVFERLEELRQKLLDHR
ncbi:MAG TPA: hypothetical protein VFO60_05625 [Candidatus Dormibacteraeota bacterium]|nr:hypothetical protein [Candidatus Dormibacteraeota bacterium]